MRTLFLDCGSGASGDMLAGALLSVISEEKRKQIVEKLNSCGIPDVKVSLSEDSKCGIKGLHFSVKIKGAEEGKETSHGHHRSMKEIQEIINTLDVSEKVRKDVLSTYNMIAEAESKVHGKPVSEIHMHEVGALDAICDIIASALLMETISPEKTVISPIALGFGKVKTAHGVLPVPAPATAEILKEIPCYAGDVEGELCTPTGAAILKQYADSFSQMPVMTIDKVGYGTGTKDLPSANVLRAVLGNDSAGLHDNVVELVCNLDDMTGEEIGYAAEKLFDAGAKEVFTAPVNMKKFRPGTLLTVICSYEDKERMAEMIFKHTTTIGIREKRYERMILSRSESIVHTEYGDVRKKTVSGYGTERSKYEYNDLKRIADENDISIRDVRKVVEKADR